MKHKLLNKLLFLLLCILGGASFNPIWADDYERITSEEGLVAGAQYILVCEGQSKAMGTIGGSTSVGSSQPATITSNTITATSSYNILTLGGSSSEGWTFYTSKESKYFSWSSGNSLAVSDAVNGDNQKWTISFDSNNTVILNKKDNTRKLQFNAGSPRFACYNSKQTAIQLYKKKAVPVSSVVVAPTSATIGVGGKVDLTATVSPDNATDKSIKWSSDDEDVATVSSSGVVTGVAEGEVDIWATSNADGTKKAKCTVTVETATPVTGVTLNVTSKAMKVGEDLQLTATVAPADATNKNVSWESSDNTVATVTSAGLVTAAKAGSATITVTTEDGSFTATCSLTITNVDVTGVTLDKTSATIYVGAIGNTVQLTPTIAPANATITTVTWSSDDEGVATVSSTGLVTAVAVGTATITVTTTDGSFTATCDVTVDNAPGSSANPYTVTLAKAAIDAGTGTTGVYVKGIVSRVTAFNDPGITYWISEDGTTTDEFEVYKGLGIGGADFTAITDVKVGDKVVITGDITLYKTTYEFSASSQLVSIATLNFEFDDDDYTIERGGDLTITATSNNSSGDVTYASDDTDVAEINATTGVVTAKKEGTATITATIAAADGFPGKSIDVELTVTDSREAANISFAKDSDYALDKDGEYTQVASVAQGDYTGTISYVIESSTSDGALIDDATGDLVFDKKGTIVVKASAPETVKYKANTATYTLKVRTTPTILVSNQSIAFEGTYTYDAASNVVGGDVTVTSGNTTVATVAGYVLTGEAVGTSTITVATAANDEYIEGNETFVLTVTAPTGSDKAPTSDVTVFEETFDTNDGTGGNDDSWSGTIATNDIAYDNSGWTCSNGKGANRCAKFGTGSAGGSAQTPALGEAGTFTLTFKAAAWNATKEGTSLSVSASNATLRNADDTEDVSSVTLTKGAWTTYTLTVKDATADAKITFSTGGGNQRFFLDEVKVTKHVDPSASITLNTSGYATYCSVNPMDFSSTEGYTAWRISNIDADGTITFNKITEAIKGGQGVLLFNKDADGVNTSNVIVNFADGSTEFTPSENKLIGTTAPTYVDAETVYGLSNNKFVKNSTAGNIPAGKAYLDASSIPTEVKAFTFVFEDEADGIAETRQATREEVEAIFNLAGQRIQKMQKGINIVNGKKILK